jgi:hypothetical protein
VQLHCVSVRALDDVLCSDRTTRVVPVGRGLDFSLDEGLSIRSIDSAQQIFGLAVTPAFSLTAEHGKATIRRPYYKARGIGRRELCPPILKFLP